MAVTAVDGALAYLLGLDLGDVPVLDGAQRSIGDEVVVVAGHNGESTGASAAGASRLARAAFEPATRDEAGTVTLAVVAQSGASDDQDLADCRASSLAVLDLLEAALLADPRLGGSVSDSWVSAVELRQDRNTDGAVVRRVVTLSFEVFR